MNYLKNEIDIKPFKQKESTKKNLDSETIAISFNYTDTAKNISETLLTYMVLSKKMLLFWDMITEMSLALLNMKICVGRKNLPRKSCSSQVFAEEK